MKNQNVIFVNEEKLMSIFLSELCIHRFLHHKLLIRRQQNVLYKHSVYLFIFNFFIHIMRNSICINISLSKLVLKCPNRNFIDKLIYANPDMYYFIIIYLYRYWQGYNQRLPSYFPDSSILS